MYLLAKATCPQQPSCMGLQAVVNAHQPCKQGDNLTASNVEWAVHIGSLNLQTGTLQVEINKHHRSLRQAEEGRCLVSYLLVQQRGAQPFITAFFSNSTLFNYLNGSCWELKHTLVHLKGVSACQLQHSSVLADCISSLNQQVQYTGQGSAPYIPAMHSLQHYTCWLKPRVNT